jgi:hypothetical protein
MPHLHLNRILDLLWYPGIPAWQSVWTILDGARDQHIYGAVQGCYLENCCLYAGTLAPELQVVAPYLVKLEREDRFTRYVINHGWDNHWGILFRSDARLDELRRHLRRFLVVRDFRGQRLIFRYYDPRVMRAYLPTCLTQELDFVFGPVDSYVMAGEEPGTMVEYWYKQTQLIDRKHQLAPAPAPAVAGVR